MDVDSCADIVNIIDNGNNDDGKSFINITMKDEDDTREVKIESNGTILLSSVNKVFSNISTLKYLSSGSWRIVKCVGGVLHPPEDDGSWGQHTYHCIVKKKKKITRSSGDHKAGNLDTYKLKSILVSRDDVQPGEDPDEEEFRKYFSKFGSVEFCQARQREGEQFVSVYVTFAEEGVACKLYGKSLEIEGIKHEIIEPKTVDKDLRVLAVNYDKMIAKHQIKEHFDCHGQVTDVYIPSPYKCFALVTLSNYSDCRRLYRKVHTHAESGVSLKIMEPKHLRKKRLERQLIRKQHLVKSGYNSGYFQQHHYHQRYDWHDY